MSPTGPCFGKKELDETVSVGHESIRILTVDDHPLFRSGIAALLATQPDMSLVAEASTARGYPAVPNAPPRHYAHGLADARDEWSRGDDRDSQRISRSANHHTDHLYSRCPSPARHE